MQLASHIPFEDFLCASALGAIFSYINTSKYMFGQLFSTFGCTFPLKGLCKPSGAIFILCLGSSDVSKEMWDAENFNKYSSKFTENFQVIVLKALRILNVNWELTLQ